MKGWVGLESKHLTELQSSSHHHEVILIRLQRMMLWRHIQHLTDKSDFVVQILNLAKLDLI